MLSSYLYHVCFSLFSVNKNPFNHISPFSFTSPNIYQTAQITEAASSVTMCQWVENYAYCGHIKNEP